MTAQAVVVAPIGFGATAAVYRALDRDTKSEVAVKILYKNLRDDAVRYFAQEGRLAARIVHPSASSACRTITARRRHGIGRMARVSGTP